MVDAEATSTDVFDAGFEIELEVGQGKRGKSKGWKEGKLVKWVHPSRPTAWSKVCVGVCEKERV